MYKIQLESKLLACFIMCVFTGRCYVNLKLKRNVNIDVVYVIFRLSKLRIDPYLNPYKNLKEN